MADYVGLEGGYYTKPPPPGRKESYGPCGYEKGDKLKTDEFVQKDIADDYGEKGGLIGED